MDTHKLAQRENDFIPTLTVDRLRRVKCDELYPHCNNCISKGYECEGVSSVLFAKTNTSSPTSDNKSDTSLSGSQSPLSSPCKELTNIPTRSPREKRAFSWIVSITVDSVTNPVDRNFWAITVPQLAQSDDMVWYAMIAISTLFEHPLQSQSQFEPFTDLDSTYFYRRQALEWYGRSLKAVPESVTKGTPFMTLSGFLFSTIELLQGRPRNGLALMHQAFQVNQGDSDATAAETEVLEALLPHLTRAMLPFSLFGLPLTDTQRQRARPTKTHQHNTNQTPSHLATSLMLDLFDLCYTVQTFCNLSATTHPNPIALATQQTLLTRMSTWHTSLQTTNLLTTTPSTDPNLRIFLAQQLILYHTALVRLSTLFSPSLLDYDDHESSYRTIVSEAELALPLSPGNTARRIPYDLSLVPCLYYTAWACRRPRLRRRAIALLRDRAPRAENLWMAEQCVEFAEGLVAWEEGRGKFVEEVGEEEDRVMPVVGRRVPVAMASGKLGGLMQSLGGGGAGEREVKLGLGWGEGGVFVEEMSGKMGMGTGGMMPSPFWKV